MKLHEVFGVSRDPVASYIERAEVDDALKDALSGTRQIVIYGSSKQGKTSLLHRHVPDSQRITVHCGPQTTIEDVYRSLLRQQDVEVVTERVSDSGREISAGIASRFKAMIPLVGGGAAEGAAEITSRSGNATNYKTIEFNLANGQDVGELLLGIDCKKLCVLENFHYLAEEVQRQLAFDLRTFEEMGLRFVILGVWKERNRLEQHNGDLQDRVAEVPVEPWEEGDFARVVETGEGHLNIKIAPALRDKIFSEAHGSVAVVQELLKKLCEHADVEETCPSRLDIEDKTYLESAIEDKVQEYASRHIRSLEAIAAGSRSRRATDDAVALFLPYYLVLVLVNRNFSELKDGIERKTLQELIKDRHAHPDNVRTSDVTGMLQRLPKLQNDASIVPPLFDWDPGSRRLKVVDSTLFFFIDNCDPEAVMNEIPHPDPAQQ